MYLVTPYTTLLFHLSPGMMKVPAYALAHECYIIVVFYAVTTFSGMEEIYLFKKINNLCLYRRFHRF